MGRSMRTVATAGSGRYLRPLVAGALWLVAVALTASAAGAADLTRADVQKILAATPKGEGASFVARSLAGLDLHDLDFSGADLSRADLAQADLRGAKLVGTKLVGADLHAARLNQAWIMRADFSGANLTGAALETLVVSEGMETRPDEAARFAGADLSDARMVARFSLDDMQGANLSRVHAAADMRNQSMGLIRADFSRANLAGAKFTGAALGNASFEFAKLQHADFSGADVSDADFDGADLTDADFTRAKTDGASFDSAVLTGVRGLVRR